jgi:nucleotide-binding universal stress UspA family protein
VKNILVAVDSFENLSLSSPLFESTIELARAFSSKIWMLHVAPPSGHYPFNIDNDMLRREVAHELKDQHRFLQQLAESLREIDIDATSVMVKGETVKTIISEADRLKIDLIILGCHMHRQFISVLTRDTAKSMLGKCKHPILFIPITE